jgi:hypothetical protein
MAGRSLLAGGGDSYAPILAVNAVDNVYWGKWQLRDDSRPPHSILCFTSVICDHWYRYYLHNGATEAGQVRGHTGACDPRRQPPGAMVFEAMVAYLRGHGILNPR